MFSLVAGFAARRRKRSVSLEGVGTSSSEEKQPKPSPLGEEAQKDWVVVLVESPCLAFDDQSPLGDCSTKANIPLEGEVPAVSPPCVEKVGMGDPSGVIAAPAPSPKLTGAGPTKKRLPDRVIISTYVPPLERVHPSTNIWRVWILRTC